MEGIEESPAHQRDLKARAGKARACDRLATTTSFTSTLYMCPTLLLQMQCIAVVLHFYIQEIIYTQIYLHI